MKEGNAVGQNAVYEQKHATVRNGGSWHLVLGVVRPSCNNGNTRPAGQSLNQVLDFMSL